jgi:hypothetical protein
MSIFLVLQSHLKVLIIQLNPSPKLPYIADALITSRVTFKFLVTTNKECRSQWPRGLSCRSAAAGMLRLWVRIPPRTWKFFSVVSVVCYRYRFLRRADHSSREVLPTVMRRCVWFRHLVNEEVMAHWGVLAPKTNKQIRNTTCPDNELY